MSNFHASEAIGPVMQRLELLDVLRGFALFGILTFNITTFSGYSFLNSSQAAVVPFAFADPALSTLVTTLVEAKFYSLFSLLFGAGFAIIYRRTQQYGKSSTRLLVRRYCGLLVIGLAHAFLLWFGDILVLYALLGFLLPAFRDNSERSLAAWSIALLLSPIVFYGLGLALLPAGAHSGPPASLIHMVDTLKSGSYFDIVASQIAVYPFLWLRRLILMFYPRVFGMFLLGILLERVGVFQDPARHASLLRALARAGLFVGLPLSIGFAVLDRHEAMLPPTVNGWIRTTLESFGTPLLCLGYVAWVTRALQKACWQRYLRWLAPVGRMGLTNYLSQSLICVVLFYGLGGNLMFRVSYTTSLGLALVIYAAQVLISHLWLSHFAYGPVEWVWRQLTYGKRFPLRQRAEHALARGS